MIPLANQACYNNNADECDNCNSDDYRILNGSGYCICN